MFQQFAAEYNGDACALSQLYAAYQKQLWVGMENKLLKMEAERDGILEKSSWNTPDANTFCNVFNDLCNYSFVSSLYYFQD